jgi:hypothetical protein
MRKLAITAGLLLAFTGCKKNKWDKAISDTEGFKDQMCACKDAACTEDVHKKYKEWEKGMMADMGKDEKPPDNVMEKAEKVEKEMRDCRNKYRKGDGDMAAPPAPPAGGEAPPAAPAGSGSAAAPAGEAPKTP